MKVYDAARRSVNDIYCSVSPKWPGVSRGKEAGEGTLDPVAEGDKSDFPLLLGLSARDPL